MLLVVTKKTGISDKVLLQQMLKVNFWEERLSDLE